MNQFVLDSSVALNWVLQDQPERFSDATFWSLSGAAVLVPNNFILELIHVLSSSERRGRLQAATTEQFLRTIASLNFTALQPESAHVLGLCREYSVSAYDAAYLSIAISHACPLATFDGRLVEASRRAALPEIDWDTH